MRAWRVHGLGEPADVLTLEERPSLDAGPGEAVVDVGACGLNFSDVLLCRGEYQETPPLPFTPGTEVVGSVVALAPDAPAAGIELGDRVLARAVLPDGGLAEQARVDAARVLPVPDTLTDTDAAALHVTYQTAWFGLHQRARLQPGETLLVTAGAGGTGSAAIQLGVAAGARVLATAGSADKLAVCRELGAELVIDHRADDVVSAIRDATGGEGVDVAFDTVGGDLFDQVRRGIAFEGRLVVVGFASGRIPDVPANHLMVKNYAVLGLHWPGYERHHPELVRRAHAAIVDLHRRGHVRPLVGEVHPLADAPDALTRLARGRTTGKVVVCP